MVTPSWGATERALGKRSSQKLHCDKPESCNKVLEACLLLRGVRNCSEN